MIVWGTFLKQNSSYPGKNAAVKGSLVLSSNVAKLVYNVSATMIVTPIPYFTLQTNLGRS